MRILLGIIFICIAHLTFAQKVLVDNDDFYFYYSLEGDSLQFTFEFLNDNSVDLDDSDSTNLDWLQLQFDHNQNGLIDQLSKVDLYYMLDTAQSFQLCSGMLVDANTIDPCGSNATNGRMSVALESTQSNSSNHLVINLVVPQNEWFTGSHVCTRLSIQGASSTSGAFHFPNDPGASYFVQPHYAIQLFPDVELGDDARVCLSDTVASNADYPFYFWSDLSVGEYVVVDQTSEVILTVEDNTCSLKDTIEITVLSEDFCEGKIYNYPNVVTPNGDNFNDLFEPLLSEEVLGDPSLYQNAELSIYNRWGVLVYGSEGYPSWDGYLDSGNLATTGTYYFVMKSNNAEGYVLTGFFELLH